MNTPEGHALALIVDDDPVSRMVLSRILRALDVPFATAIDGEEAVELVGRRPIETVLLDLRLPGIDGCETARRMRLISARRLRIVALSASWSDHDVEEANGAGLTERLQKPVSTEALAALFGVASPSSTPNTVGADCLRLDKRTFQAFRQEIARHSTGSFHAIVSMMLSRLSSQLDDAVGAEPMVVRSIAHTARAGAAWIGAQLLARKLAELEAADEPTPLLTARARDARTELAEVEKLVETMIVTGAMGDDPGATRD